MKSLRNCANINQITSNVYFTSAILQRDLRTLEALDLQLFQKLIGIHDQALRSTSNTIKSIMNQNIIKFNYYRLSNEGLETDLTQRSLCVSADPNFLKNSFIFVPSDPCGAFRKWLSSRASEALGVSWDPNFLKKEDGHSVTMEEGDVSFFIKQGPQRPQSTP